jgi:hypothetical protein
MIMTIEELKESYKPIEAEMKLWRRGLNSLPESYVKHHENLAEEGLKALTDRGILVHSKQTVMDGWGDGMRLLQVVIETPSGELLKLKWHDSHYNGSFFKIHKSGGSSRLSAEDLFQ